MAMVVPADCHDFWKEFTKKEDWFADTGLGELG
jgi:hypothetical protein